MPTEHFKGSDGFIVPVLDTHCPDRPIQAVMEIGFFVVDNNWTVIYWNEAAETITGKRSQEVVGQDLWECCGMSVPEEFYVMYQDTFRQQIPDDQQSVLHWAKMGMWKDVVSYASAATLSISFRGLRPARPERYVQDLRAFLNIVYRFVTEVSADCFWEWDMATRQFFWLDGGHKRVLGYPIVDAIVPQEFWEGCIHPEDKARVLASLAGAIGSGSSTIWEDEYRFRRMDGSWCTVQDRAYIICDKLRRPLRMIGAAHDITARREVERKALESERTLAEERLSKQKEVTEAVLEAQELERAEMGKELHDNLNQILGAAKMYIELAKTDEESRAFCLNKSAALITLVIDNIRNLSRSLTMPERQVMRITESINILLDELDMANPIDILFNERDIDEERLGDRLRHDIFRIVQEQVNNILKHAEASAATISLWQDHSNLLLQIADNGKGCDLSLESDGIGMWNIRTRVGAHHGEVSIVSAPGKGFELMITIPLSAHKVAVRPKGIGIAE